MTIDEEYEYMKICIAAALVSIKTAQHDIELVYKKMNQLGSFKEVLEKGEKNEKESL